MDNGASSYRRFFDGDDNGIVVLAFDAIVGTIEITFASDIDIQVDERIVKWMEK